MHWHDWPAAASPIGCHNCYRRLDVGDRFVVCRRYSGGWGVLCASPPNDCFALEGDPTTAVGYVRVGSAAVDSGLPSRGSAL